MKFICNNCGFSAEIPEKIDTCPMCGSANVSLHTASQKVELNAVNEPSENSFESKKDNVIEEKKINSSESSMESKKTKEPGKPKISQDKITLTDDFFERKQDEEQREIAKVLKELGGGEVIVASNNSMIKMIVAGVVAILLIVFAVVYFSSGSSDADTTKKVVSKAKSSIPKKEKERVESTHKVVEKKIVKQVKKVEPKKEKQIKKQEVSKKVEKESVKKVLVSKHKRQKKIRKTVHRKKTKTNFVEFNKLLQAGHIALKEGKYSDALHLYKAAKRFRPRYGKIYKFIGIAYAYMHNMKKVCKNYKLYLRYDPNAKDKVQVKQYLKSCQ